MFSHWDAEVEVNGETHLQHTPDAPDTTVVACTECTYTYMVLVHLGLSLLLVQL